MSETNKSQFKKTLLMILIVLLFLLVSIQAWYLLEIKQQLDGLSEQQGFAQSGAQGDMSIGLSPETPLELSVDAPVETPVAVQEETAAAAATEKIIAEERRPEVKGTGENSLAEKRLDEKQLALQAEQNQKPAMPAAPVKPEEESNITDNQPLLDLDDAPAQPFDLQRWNPYAEIQRMQREMDRRFYQSFNRYNSNPGFQRRFSQSASTPEMRVTENLNQYVVYVNLPGANESDISVTLNGQRLSVKGKQDYKKQDRDAMGNVIFQERRSGRFQRSITLSEPVSEKGMKTQLENGVLRITIPKVKGGAWR